MERVRRTATGAPGEAVGAPAEPVVRPVPWSTGPAVERPESYFARPVAVSVDGGRERAAASVAATFEPAPVEEQGALRPATRERFERHLQAPLDSVRVHAGDEARRAADSVGAAAYALGEDIVVGRAGLTWRRLAHELTHVVQARHDPAPAAHLDPAPVRTMTVRGDRQRRSPDGGVAVRGGRMDWTLDYVGVYGELTVGSVSVVPAGGATPAGGVTPAGGATPAPTSQPAGSGSVIPGDVRMVARFTPDATLTSSPTVTWIQTVRATTGGVTDIGRLTITRDAASGASVDAGVADREPFYGAEPRAPTAAPEGWTESAPGWAGSTGQTPWVRGGSVTSASHGDLPHTFQMYPGTTITRSFEAAVVGVETGETFGSIDWGYTKTSAGEITLTGGRPADVRTTGASAAFEGVRQAFYRGQFQHSLSGFARGSSTLSSAHEATLDTLPLSTLTAVTLVGANDHSGGPEANPTLSLERARAAARYLVRRHRVPAGILRVEGHGVEARVPNAPGADVPANRRVDVMFRQGAGRFVTPPRRAGSRADRARIRAMDPRDLVDDTVDWIFELGHRTLRPTGLDVQSLDDRLEALDRWRRTDPTVPDLRVLYAPQIRAIRERHLPPPPRERPTFELAPLEPPSFLDRIRPP